MDKVELARRSPFLLILVLLLGTLSFSAALAWNEMAKSFVMTYIDKDNTFRAASYYALVITSVLIIVALLLAFLFPQIFDAI